MALGLLAGPVGRAHAQGRVIDSIAVVTEDVFGPVEAKRSFAYRLTNALHVTTQPYVVRRELLFKVGQPYDSADVAETARNLRAMGLFSRVTIDTLRYGDSLMVRVMTRDAWTTHLNLTAHSSGGVFTWAVGMIENNVAGTGNMAGLGYRQEADRTAFTVQSAVRRPFGSTLQLFGLYDDLSDGSVGQWDVGVPLRALADRSGFDASGERDHRRVLEFRDGDVAVPAVSRRTAFIQRLTATWAPIAGTGGYLRVGFYGQVRHEEFVRAADTLLAVPDTVSAAAGPFAEWLHARFLVTKHYNGFAAAEDVDLSTRLKLTALATPTIFGYDRMGIAPAAEAQTGAVFGRQFVKLVVSANGRFTGAGLDSGRVAAGLTLVSRALPRQAAVLHIEAGVQQRPSPGTQFDLGDSAGPRAFGPHAFTGTRMVWGTLEHRVFFVDQVLGTLGLGAEAFVDYGGAWYADEKARAGGDLGLGLRFGPTRSSAGYAGRLDLAWRFGAGAPGNRWAIAFGRSYQF